MIKVTVIGSGAVAEAFAKALSRCESRYVALCEVVGRNSVRINDIASSIGGFAGDINNLKAADLYILAVSDGVICELAQSLSIPKGSYIVHCAGGVGLEEGVDGVIYPMQSFTTGREVDFSSVPLFLEARNEEVMYRIDCVARALSGDVRELSSEGRGQLHLGAVFACNFVNAMFTASGEVLEGSGVGFDIYRPLIEETVRKALESGDPRMVQSGAARRGDITTQARHLERLSERGDLSEIYKLITQYIWEISKRI